MLPLSNITVITLEHAIAAPFCTRQLADLGARVIKIERPNVGDFARHYDDKVDGLSSHFVWTNRSKESLTLDLQTPEAQDILQQLIVKADVFVQNLAPGAAARLNLSYDVLSQLNPKLIVCDISGYGSHDTTTPYYHKKAYDLLIQAESGFLSITGTEDSYAKAGCSIADISAGMYAYSNILAALLARAKTGKGKYIDISMLESMTEWMGFPLYYTLTGGAAPKRSGASHATIYPYGPFDTGDHRQVLLGVQNEREWKTFCSLVLEQTDLATHPDYHTNALRSQNRAALQVIINQVFIQLEKSEIIHRLQVANIAHSDINDMQSVWQHPQLAARKRWTQVDSPVGSLPALKPVGVSVETDFVMNPIPDLGQHSAMILEELGYESHTIADLTARGII